jgi:23S rRNA (uracil1939-C5)-methyltransferase
MDQLRRGDELTLKLESFAFEGKSIARLDGLVVSVHGGVPGDDVRVRLSKIKKQFLEAEVVEVISKSTLRTEPRCRYFGTCGGCKWQDVSYTAQLDFKRQHVVDALERIGGFEDITVKPTLRAEEIYFYRNKMEFSFGDRWLTKEAYAARRDEEHGSDEIRGGRREGITFALGMHIPQRFDKVLDLEECHLQSEVSGRIVNAVRTFCLEHQLAIHSTFTHTGYLRNLVIRQSSHTNELMVNLVTSEDQPELMRQFTTELLAHFPAITTIINNITDRKSQVAIGETEKVYHGSGYITELIGARRYHISANSFFQTNTKQAERLYEAARRLANLKPDDVVFDLYSGTGTIALHVADFVNEVVGVESVEAAVLDARRNAIENNITNCTFVLGDLKDRLTKDTQWLANHPKPSVVITDPPRSGMHEKVVKEILALAPDRIVYVSCNPTTQARDLQWLCTDSRYRVVEVQPVDMFPHTYHIENVVGLTKA